MIRNNKNLKKMFVHGLIMLYFYYLVILVKNTSYYQNTSESFSNNDCNVAFIEI